MTKPHSHIRISKQAALIEFLRKAWPAFGEEVFHLRERFRYARKFGNLQRKFWRDHFAPEKPTVLSGPFEGMRYLQGNVMGPPLPRWLGTYEAELHEVIRKSISKKTYDIILVVGSAEGFYACGLARLFPTTPILSFESTLVSRWQQRKLLKINHIRQVEIRGKLEIQEFLRLVKNKKSLCLLDIEGAELEFCGAAALPCLGRADLLVEIHASGRRSPGEVLKEIESRLNPSHRTQILNPVQRKIAEIQAQARSRWTTEALEQAAEEHRGFAQQWLWAEARQNLRDNCMTNQPAPAANK
jgi:hypothetical protein